MFNPKVSIIIPVYNWSNYLSEAIESALAQTYNNIEILVINDGSTDMWATEKIALSFGNKINYIHKENGWVSTALNLWIEKANWEYISWLSHDDLYYPNKIEEQIKVLKVLENKETLIYSNLEQINFNWTIINESVSQNIPNDKILFSFLIREHWINWCTTLISKKVFEDVWLFNINYKRIQDYDMWFRIMEKYPVYYIDKILFTSREHPWQDTHSRNIKDEVDLLEIWWHNIKKYSLIHLYKNSIYTWIIFIKRYFFIYIQMIIIRPMILWLYKNNHRKICQYIWKILEKIWFHLYYIK
jgi:hypothetical protein